MDEFKAGINKFTLACGEQFSFSKENIIKFRTDAVAFKDNQDAKCYANCVLEDIKFLSDGKFNYELVKIMSAYAPLEIREYMTSTTERCKNAGDGVEGKCEVAFELEKCFQKGLPAVLIDTF